jgi:hypothetical protein
MRLPKKVMIVLASLVLALLAAVWTSQAASPTPSRTSSTPTPEPKSASPVPTPPASTAEPSEPSEAPPTAFPSPPTSPSPVPKLYLKSTEPYTANGKNFIRCSYDVLNKMDYPAALFSPAPSLPPCGANANSSRTWVDFFKQDGTRIYGFCALGKPEDLGEIWFAVEEGVIPPSWVYIEINDRQTNTKYKSNLAETTM